MDYHAYYRKAEAGGYQEYYDAIAKAQGIDPQATARTRNAEDAVPGEGQALQRGRRDQEHVP